MEQLEINYSLGGREIQDFGEPISERTFSGKGSTNTRSKLFKAQKEFFTKYKNYQEIDCPIHAKPCDTTCKACGYRCTETGSQLVLESD